MRNYYVYILKCSDNSYYTGVTNDLGRRLEEHKRGVSQDSYTSTRLPVKLVFYELFNDIKQAIAFEKQVKGWSRKKKEALMRDDWNLLPELAKCKNQTSHLNFRKAIVEGQAPFDSAQGDTANTLTEQ